jgi:hypothetical protein
VATDDQVIRFHTVRPAKLACELERHECTHAVPVEREARSQQGRQRSGQRLHHGPDVMSGVVVQSGLAPRQVHEERAQTAEHRLTEPAVLVGASTSVRKYQ